MASQTLVLIRWPVEWQALEDMQDFVSRYCRRRWSADLADRARIVGQELFENALRYAVAPSDVIVEVRDMGAGFEIRVTNDAVESRLAILNKRVADLAEGAGSQPDAARREAYKKALRKLLTETGEQGLGGGLGLLRVVNEANVALQVQIEGKRATVIATAIASTWTAQSPGTPLRRDDVTKNRPTKEGHGKVR